MNSPFYFIFFVLATVTLGFSQNNKASISQPYLNSFSFNKNYKPFTFEYIKPKLLPEEGYTSQLNNNGRLPVIKYQQETNYSMPIYKRDCSDNMLVYRPDGKQNYSLVIIKTD